LALKDGLPTARKKIKINRYFDDGNFFSQNQFFFIERIIKLPLGFGCTGRGGCGGGATYGAWRDCC